MRSRLLVLSVGFVVAALSATVATTAAAGETAASPTGQYASFEGAIIDLTAGRGDAGACAITATGNRCYRTEAEMDAAERIGLKSTTSAAGNCASSLRLYSGTSYTGSVTSITARSTWINLSTYGVDNTTSSYRVGACAAALRAGSNGTGSNYPGNTGAGAESAWMMSGWDNVVSSVRLS